MTATVLRFVWQEGADRAIPLPRYQSEGAAGADIRANLPVESRTEGLVLHPMERLIVPTGLGIEIPDGFEVQLRPRSGLALEHGITLCNSPGTIDADFRGPVRVLLINLGDRPFTVGHGDRIAQMVVAPVVKADFKISGVRSPTGRNASGFGSTGIH